MNKSNLSVTEYKNNVQADLNGSVVKYQGTTFIMRDVNFADNRAGLYSTMQDDAPCHIVELDLIEFV